MSRKNIIRIIAIIIVSIGAVGILIAQIITPKEARAEVEQKSGFSTITSVAGCVFMVNSSFVEQATAVTQISEGVNFTKSDFYSYKNGTDQYMLFQLNGIVVAVEKGTAFKFEETKKKEDALNNSSIMGIWFGTDKEGLKYNKSGERTECNVTAQVVITNDLYADFIGKLVTLTDGEEEWSMFVGVPGDRYKKLDGASKDGINAIIDTFKLLPENTGEFKEPEYAVVISGNNAGEIISTAASENEIEEIPVMEETTVSGGNASETEAVPPATESSVSEDVPVASEPLEEEAGTEEVQAEETSTVSADTGSQYTPLVEPQLPHVTFKSVVKENVDDDKAYSSSVYSMLSIGQSGLYDAKEVEGDDCVKLVAKLTGIYDSTSTKEYIEKAFAAGAPIAPYSDAPAGCHWESAEFDLNYAGVAERPYTNIKLVGADGGPLKFRGIKYSTRTHDLAADRADGEWIRGFRVYYAIPNGCTEYVLRVGDGDDINGWQSAYYHVNRTT